MSVSRLGQTCKILACCIFGVPRERLHKWTQHGLGLSLAFLFAASGSFAAADQLGSLRLTIVDSADRQLPCRVHLKNSEGLVQLPTGFPTWDDHFVCSGEVTVDLSPGLYSYEIERGPEYEHVSNEVEITAGKQTRESIRLDRISNLRTKGWYSADLHVHRPLEDIELLMQAEDLDFAPVISWWNDKNSWENQRPPKPTAKRFDGHRIYTVMAGEDERKGGALLYFGLERPLDLTDNTPEFPSPMKFVTEARGLADSDSRIWIDIEKPFWWDVPTWLASGQMNSVGLAYNHMCRTHMLENEAWGRGRNTQRLPPPRGNGFWTQEIYYHILNTGLRIPPSAGSASGVLANPLGYNRVYVHLEQPFSRNTWFDALAQGRCFVTNGPLLLASANNALPGKVLKIERGTEEVDIEILIQLTSKDRVPNLELILNGKVHRVVECSKDSTGHHRISFSATSPGWFLVRALTDVEETFRFASTGPWYIEDAGGESYVSRHSSQFFLDWVNERISRIEENVTEVDQLREVLKWHHLARSFWAERVRSANGE